LIDGDQPGPRTNGWVKATAATVVAVGAEKLTLGWLRTARARYGSTT